MITVTHKKGKHAPNLGAVLYCYRKLLFSRSVKITVLFDEDSMFTVDKPTFFKVCGWKSKLADGALDKSVRERLLAYKLNSQYRRIIDVYKCLVHTSCSILTNPTKPNNPNDSNELEYVRPSPAMPPVKSTS